jgi:NAD(P)-dependent dehydrogenase (short-subunit alcohol dehydrogenase family)
MRALAVELAPDTRVNSILPGALDTAMAASAMSDAEVAANVKASYPLGIGKPEDIANAVQFLLSDEARWLTGQELVIDGGRTVNFSLK